MRIAKWGLVAVLTMQVTLSGIATAQQQPAGQTGGTSQQEDSLAAAARRAREQKKQQPKAVKVWNNDDIPTTAGLSVIGQGSTAPDSAASQPPNGQSAAAKADAKPVNEASKKQDVADLAAAKDQLQTLQNDLDILRRKFTLDQQAALSKPGFSLDDSGSASLKEEQGEVDAKQQEISDQQKKVEDLQAKSNGTSPDSAASPSQNSKTGANQDSADSGNQTSTSDPNQPKSPN